MAKEKASLNINKISEHPFVQLILKEYLEVYKRKKPKITLTKTTFKEPLSDKEYYIWSAGNSLVHFLVICEQLSHIPLYLLSYCPSSKMKKEGVTRHSHVLYCVENYIIRIRILYDRILQLINNIFKIYDPPDHLNHRLIINNAHVKFSKLPPKLKKLKKITDKYYYQRTKIVH